MADLRKSSPPNDQQTPGEADALPPPEVFTVTSKRVSCDGGGGALGHPLVFLHIERDGDVVCPYCSRRFVLDEGAPTAHGH